MSEATSDPIAQVTAASSAAPASAAPTGVLRLRGLPFAATSEDVTNFFDDFKLSNIFFCKRNGGFAFRMHGLTYSLDSGDQSHQSVLPCTGRSTGEVFVTLEEPANAPEALQKLNKQHLGHRYVE